jgi:hypothetical protein
MDLLSIIWPRSMTRLRRTPQASTGSRSVKTVSICRLVSSYSIHRNAMLTLLKDPGQWGTVYHLLDNNGWGYVDLPSCLASGNYLLRTEAISLHTAPVDWYEGTQHFISCANINIVGGGSWAGSNHLQFPGQFYDSLTDIGSISHSRHST